MTVRVFFGGLLIVIGWLIVLYVGGCSLLIFSDMGIGALIVLVPALVPLLLGFGIIGIGKMVRGETEFGGSKFYKNPYAKPENMHKKQQDREARLKEDNDLFDEEEF